MRRAGSDEDVGSDDTIGAQHTDAKISDVHGPAFATATTAFPTEQLTHHSERVGALDHGVPVATVSRQQHIIGLQFAAHTHGRCFLTNRRVDRPVHVTIS